MSTLPEYLNDQTRERTDEFINSMGNEELLFCFDWTDDPLPPMDPSKESNEEINKPAVPLKAIHVIEILEALRFIEKSNFDISEGNLFKLPNVEPIIPNSITNFFGLKELSLVRKRIEQLLEESLGKTRTERFGEIKDWLQTRRFTLKPHPKWAPSVDNYYPNNVWTDNFLQEDKDVSLLRLKNIHFEEIRRALEFLCDFISQQRRQQHYFSGTGTDGARTVIKAFFVTSLNPFTIFITRVADTQEITYSTDGRIWGLLAEHIYVAFMKFKKGEEVPVYIVPRPEFHIGIAIDKKRPQWSNHSVLCFFVTGNQGNDIYNWTLKGFDPPDIINTVATGQIQSQESVAIKYSLFLSDGRIAVAIQDYKPKSPPDFPFNIESNFDVYIINFDGSSSSSNLRKAVDDYFEFVIGPEERFQPYIDNWQLLSEHIRFMDNRWFFVVTQEYWDVNPNIVCRRRNTLPCKQNPYYLVFRTVWLSYSPGGSVTGWILYEDLETLNWPDKGEPSHTVPNCPSDQCDYPIKTVYLDPAIDHRLRTFNFLDAGGCYYDPRANLIRLLDFDSQTSFLVSETTTVWDPTSFLLKGISPPIIPPDGIERSFVVYGRATYQNQIRGVRLLTSEPALIHDVFLTSFDKIFKVIYRTRSPLFVHQTGRREF